MVELFQFEFCALRGNGMEVWGVQKKCGGHGFELQWTTKTNNSLSFSWEENNSHDYFWNSDNVMPNYVKNIMF